MAGPERIYYDGGCPFCRRWAGTVARLDRGGRRFLLSPLSGPDFRARVPPDRRDALAGTVVVERADGALLVRSEAVVHVLRRLGPSWRLLGDAVALLPRPLRDLAYRAFARRGGDVRN